jgi:aspartate-semialdehyde dehydrogenase
MSERKLRIGVAGATGAVGREIVTLLNQTELPVGAVVPMASPACRTHTVEVGGGNVRVENLLPELVATCDLVFFAVPPQVAAEPIRAAMDEGVAIVDLTGTLGPADQVPLVVPAVNRLDLAGFYEHQAVASPRPDVVGLAHLLGPLRAQAGDLRCRGMVMHSAALRGRAGVEELSNQVVSLFNSRTPQRTTFVHGLAFDLEPMVGALGATGWSDHELRIAGQASTLLRLAPDRLVVAAMIGPWFNGVTFSLQIETDSGLDAAQVAAIYEATPSVALCAGGAPGDLPRPRGVDGSTLMQVGRLRDDPSGGSVHLWAVADELRFGAAGNAVSLLAALIQDDLI